MRVTCAPDSFKESISAVDAADAMALGIRQFSPQISIDCCPVGDGGDGTLESLLASIQGQLVPTEVVNQNGIVIESEIGVFDNGSLAFVESAKAIGIANIAATERNIMSASSFGVGQLIKKAIDLSPERIIVGIGGSSTTDGGCGMAQALGVEFFDAAGKLIEKPIGGADLLNIAAIDMSRQLKSNVPVTVACDVNNPLTGANGAAQVYGPQKGATTDQVKQLDNGLRHLARVICQEYGCDIESMKGAGAAGGLGAGLYTFASAQLESGIDIVLDMVDFSGRIANADLCLTGEGRLDKQSLSGKACAGIAREAHQAGIPVAALVGSIGLSPDEWHELGITEAVTIGAGLSVEQSKLKAEELLVSAAGRVVKNFSLSGTK